MKLCIGCVAAGLALLGTAAPARASGSPAVFEGAASIGTEELAGIAGQANVDMTIRAENTSTVANNRVDGNSVTGTIAFDSQSFQNLNGLSLVSANTGNNVSINSSLNVNVTLNP